MPEPTLQAAALRYAAGDLTKAESAAFETRLTSDQDARDALAEAVRLSAAALGQEPPRPDRSFRAAIRERLLGCCPAWLRRRAYRGHPLTWTALGAGAVASCTVIGLSLAGNAVREATPSSVPSRDQHAALSAPPPREQARVEVAIAPAPREDDAPGEPGVCDLCDGRSIAEIWAHLSTTDRAEKLHDAEQRWLHRLREGTGIHSIRSVSVSTTSDNR
jgi:hypothetical protein